MHLNSKLQHSNKYDLIVSNPPYLSTKEAHKIGENVKDPITMYLQDIFTVHANLSGNPAISLPLGNHSNGMPFGVQVMAKPFAEKELFAFSQELMEI